MKLAVRNVGDVAVLDPKGMYLGGPETDELEQTLDELIQEGRSGIVVNLGQVTYMSSAPLAVLVAALNKCAAHEVPLKLCCLDKKMNLVLLITRLVMHFDTYDTEEDALASFRGARV